MKRILLSAGMIAVVGALAIGGTIAFYNDTETSTGNIFTAGSIDLKVDHTKASYNGEPCVSSCTETGGDLIVNGGFEIPEPVANGSQWEVYPSGIAGWSVVSGAGIEIQEGGVAGAPHGGDQLAELDSHGSGSQSTIEQVITTVPGGKYRLTFWHSPRPNNGPSDDNEIELNVLITSSSGVIINDTVGESMTGGSNTSWTQYAYDFVAVDGQTSIRFSDSGSQADTLGGYLDDVSMFALNCTETGFPYGGQCHLWNERDLGQDDIFWNFPDIKPGNYGTNVISLHVDSNDAFVCLLPDNLVDSDNVPTDPELEFPDPNTSQVDGELSDYLEFFGWLDDGDGLYQVGETVVLPAGTPMNQIETELVAMNLTPSQPISVGLMWCAGTQTGPQVTGDPDQITCDGNGMGNIAQTDSVVSDFVAYAIQQRNNEGFSCGDVDLDNLEE